MRKRQIIDIADYDLVIISDNGCTAVFKNGIQEDGISHIEFKHDVDDMPYLKIEKHLLKRKIDTAKLDKLLKEGDNNENFE